MSDDDPTIRDLCSKIDGLHQRLDGHDRRFDGIDSTLKPISEVYNTASGVVRFVGASARVAKAFMLIGAPIAAAWAWLFTKHGP